MQPRTRAVLLVLGFVAFASPAAPQCYPGPCPPPSPGPSEPPVPGVPLSKGNLPNSGTALDPISTASGELYGEEQPDLSLGGPLPLRFVRYYASYLKANRVS